MNERELLMRLYVASKCAMLVRNQIDENNGEYSGSFTPNLQSIMDAAIVPFEHIQRAFVENLQGTEDDLVSYRAHLFPVLS